MNYRIATLALTLGLSTIAPGLKAQKESVPTFVKDIVTNYLTFEEAQDIANWKSEKGNLSFSSAHFKDGTQSLLWTYQNGATIEIANLKGLKEAGDFYPGGQPEVYEPSFYKKSHYGGVKMWLYQEKPSIGKITFQVGSNLQMANTAPKYRFSVNLNFTGWRAVWVNFNEDALVKNYKGSDEMTSLVALTPSGQSGKIFIDHFMLLSFVSNKRHSDLQFENHKLNLRSGDGYEILAPYQIFLAKQFNQQVDVKKLTEESKTIADRLEFLILGDKTNDWKKRNTGIEKTIDGKIKGASAIFDKLGIHKANDFVNGRPLFGIRDEHIPKEGLNYDEAILPTAFPLAMDYRLNGNKTAREKLMLTFDYLQDQGWAAGSAFGTVDHVIKLNPIATAIFLVRDDLKAQNKLKAETDMLIWHTRLGSMLTIDYTRGENSDKIRGGALAKLITILLMENDSRKQELLQDFKSYMDYVASISPGYSDTFKPDFSIYHHRGTYLNTYGTNALNTMALIHWLLSGTPYQLSPQTTGNLKQALKRQAEIAYGVDIHYGAGGRFPLGNSSLDGFTFPALAYMSMNGNTIADKEMAELFNYIYDIAEPDVVARMLSPVLTYSGTFGTLNLIERLHKMVGAQKHRPADGAVSMPYSGLMAYRQGNAFATVKGYNKYVWDFESGRGENNLGRYLSHGMLVTAQGDEKMGFKSLGLGLNEGFDWSMLPGATTKMLPADKVLYYTKGDQKYIEGKHRNFSESVVASGLQQGTNGLFALDLRDDVFPDEDKSLFDNSFRARKTYFFIGNEIICLGSSIQNNDTRYPTVTTLFQYRTDEKRKNSFNGKEISASSSLNQKADGGYFTDQNGLHYIIPKGQPIVLGQDKQISYRGANVGDQKSIVLNTSGAYEKTQEVYTKAWFDHGTNPKDKGYEYEIVLNTPTADLKPYLQNKTYEVMQKNASAHIIRHPLSGITAYAVYSAAQPLKGTLIHVDRPMLAMVKEQAGHLWLSLADPDIRQPKWNHNMSHMPDSITNGWGTGSIATLTLKGAWYIAKQLQEVETVSYMNGNTILKVFCKEGKSIDIPLQHRTMDNVDTE
ncbi:chondroitinase family polysaccharide lyase [Pedobacter heparinus]|uniref:Lyase catalytic n=1 Tax=Pedobacter heparinus (strain ATCC 13125 / DSM 2366 / CIP 104194 / JCM 7457 / NBRC 12017 / NCIMB 9290 / NRRL B-14731 / HIM 762-3) TaxID=485917 RepID=C6Y1P5_PEDHD|nr:chondroitinase family polysaccharide lyase [Pedobacter heparinus]ACU05037.1 Lyase catalytic [Pedobacter heparinus DSM 2366]